MDLPPELLAKLELLRIATRRVHPGRFTARTRSKRLGAGIDFADHRPYVPGDDFKYVDWKLYGRRDQLMVRLSEEQTELNVHLMVDVSQSMNLTVGPETGDTKSHVARVSASALAYVALCNLDQVRVWPFAGELGRPLVPARRGAEVVKVWRHLADVDLAPGTDVDGAVQRFLQLSPARGVLFLISDLPESSYRTAIDRLLHAGFDVAIVHIQSPGELTLPMVGDRFDLVDGETGSVLKGVTRAEIEATREGQHTDRLTLARWCRARGVALVQTVTGAPTDLEGMVLTMFRRGGLLR